MLCEEKENKRMAKILIDTGVLISLADGSRPNHKNAAEYVSSAIEQGHILCVSALSVAEFSVKGNFDEILGVFPEINVEAFDGAHAQVAAKLYAPAREENPSVKRNIVKVDTMLIGQAIASELEIILSEDEASLIRWARDYCQRNHLPIRTLSISEKFSHDMFNEEGQQSLPFSELS